MPIKSNLTSLAPARDKFKKEITLLSHGYSMPDKLPDGLVTVYPWDQTVDDYVLKLVRKVSPDRLIFEVVKKLVNVDGVDRMVVGDVMTIMLVARALARDSSVIFESVCPACSHAEQITLAVPDQLEKVAEKTATYPGWDVVTLPICKDAVKLRPLLVRDELSVLDRPETDKISRKMARAIAALVSINDTVADSIAEVVGYFNAIPPADFTFYLEKMDELSPHLSPVVKQKCDSCGHEFTQDLNINASFFR